MRNCLYCEGELSETATFCSSCGEKQEEKISIRFCENCAEQHSLNAKFCPACATPVGINPSRSQKQYQYQRQEVEAQPKQMNQQQRREVSEKTSPLRTQWPQPQQQVSYQQQRDPSRESQQYNNSQQSSIIEELCLRERTFAVILAVVTCLQVVILFFATVAAISISRQLNVPEGYVLNISEYAENMLRGDRTEFIVTIFVSLITVAMNAYIVYLSLKFEERVMREPTKVFNQLTNPVYYIVALVYNLVFLVMAMGVWIFGFLIGAGAIAVLVYRFLKTRSFTLQNASELGIVQ